MTIEKYKKKTVREETGWKIERKHNRLYMLKIFAIFCAVYSGAAANKVYIQLNVIVFASAARRRSWSITI